MELEKLSHFFFFVELNLRDEKRQGLRKASFSPHPLIRPWIAGIGAGNWRLSMGSNQSMRISMHLGSDSECNFGSIWCSAHPRIKMMRRWQLYWWLNSKTMHLKYGSWKFPSVFYFYGRKQTWILTSDFLWFLFCSLVTVNISSDKVVSFFLKNKKRSNAWNTNLKYDSTKFSSDFYSYEKRKILIITWNFSFDFFSFHMSLWIFQVIKLSFFYSLKERRHARKVWNVETELRDFRVWPSISPFPERKNVITFQLCQIFIDKLCIYTDGIKFSDVSNCKSR